MIITGSKQTFRWRASDQARCRVGLQGSGDCSGLRSSEEVVDCRCSLNGATDTGGRLVSASIDCQEEVVLSPNGAVLS